MSTIKPAAAPGGKLTGTIWQDLRYGARMLLKKAGITLIAVITLALGILLATSAGYGQDRSGSRPPASTAGQSEIATGGEGGQDRALRVNSPVRLKSGYVTVADGARIHYLEAGRTLRQTRPDAEGRHAPSLLFVPGWMMPAEIWEAQLNHFAAAHHVVAIDPRAQGKSSKPADGHFPAMRASDIKAVVEQLKLAPVVLIGASKGDG